LHRPAVENDAQPGRSTGRAGTRLLIGGYRRGPPVTLNVGRFAAGALYSTFSYRRSNATDRRIPKSCRRLRWLCRGIAGRQCQAATLEEARANLAEAVELVLDANRALSEEALQGHDVIRERLQISDQ
jgi:hypothetical protein